MSKRRLKFKTETQKLLHLVIHSLYSHKEIFLRELLSNASDAIDKLRFLTVSDKSYAGESADYRIRIDMDKDARTVSISDNGVGMSEEELELNLGTIARSGTGSFLEALQDAKQLPELIGQFGVGFYASFMVADQVTVETRRAGSGESFRWQSDGEGEFSIEAGSRQERGTTVTLHLKPDTDEYLDAFHIRTLVKKYSDFIEYPVLMDVEKYLPKEGGDGKETVKTVTEETVNAQKAIWMKNPAEVSDAEYGDFYKHLTHDFDQPFERVHFRAEGTTEFSALLYLPARLPMDLLFGTEKTKGVQLFVRRVFILDEAEALLPRWLRFVRGVVDSSDLPLNVSRELLQQDKVLARIKSNLVKKVLDALKERKEKDAPGYAAFFRELGGVLKEGVALDFENKDKLLDLLLFESSTAPAGEPVSLAAYVARMPEGQEEIYYITGESRAEVEHSPYLEGLRAKGYEVLFLVESIDEILTQHLTEYQGKRFKSAARGSIDLDKGAADKQAELEKKSGDFQGFLGHLKEKLAARVKDVRLSRRLVTSPACLVADEYDLSANMERILKAMHQEVPDAKRILELNPDHPLIGRLKGLYEADKEGARAGELVELLYDQAVVAEGGKVADPERFAALFTKLLLESAERG